MTVTDTDVKAAGVNPLIAPWPAPYGAVPFNQIKNSDYEEAVKQGIRENAQEIDAIVNQRSTPDFENTIVAYVRSGETLNKAMSVLGNLEHAMGDPELMDILARVTPALSEHSSNIMLNEGLWNRIKQAADNSKNRTDLTPEDRRLIQSVYNSFALNGADLKGADREKYRRLMAELSELGVRYSQNVTNDMKNPSRCLWLTKDQLDGLPADRVVAARADAKAALEAEGKADDENMYLITMFFPSYSPFMKYATNRDLRRQLNTLYNSRNNGGAYDNTAILRDIANVRLEVANLLGKETFADYQLQETMAGTPGKVYELLNQLRDAYYPAWEKEKAEVTEFARQTEGPDFQLESWDYSFWADKLKNARYAFNDEDMKPYFEMKNTIDGVFGLATKLYGYKFKVNKNIPVYHPDVTAYEVYGTDGKLLGILYTDFYERAGKAPGAWMTEFRTSTKDDDGKRSLPLVSIVCNFTKPVGDAAVLMTPYEVETFLHEFGHALHGLSTQAKYQTLSGTNVYHDFVELPSQFNENYLTEKKFLDTFAKHYKTGKKMPQALLDKFLAASQFGAAYQCLRQLSFGLTDMAFHTIKTPMRASSDLANFEKQAIESVATVSLPEGCLMSPSFAHIFSGGYAAGYYGYKWAELLDADAFAAFKENGIFDKKTAAKFQKILQSGGTVDPMTLYIEFRGQEPTIDALLKRDGIKK